MGAQAFDPRIRSEIGLAGIRRRQVQQSPDQIREHEAEIGHQLGDDGVHSRLSAQTDGA